MSLIMDDFPNDVKKDTILYRSPERLCDTLWVETIINVEKKRIKNPQAFPPYYLQVRQHGSHFKYIFIQK